MSAEPARRRCILILGMHRSGTSALTRMISLAGASLPAHVMGASAGNETGHWEPDRLVGINDRMLADAGSSWSDWRRFDEGWVSVEQYIAYRNEISDCISADYGDSSLFVLKDPRICRLFPTYARVMSELGIEVLPVLCLRDAGDVIESLAARDGLGRAWSAMLWLRHVLDAEASSRDLRRAIVSYDDLLDDWRAALESIALALDIRWPNQDDLAGARTDAFISKDLRHHSGRSAVSPDEQYHWVVEASRAMAQLRVNANEESALADLDRVRTEFDEMTLHFGAAVAPVIAAKDQQIRVITTDAALAEARAQTAERALSDLLASRTWRWTQPLRDLSGSLRRSRSRGPEPAP